MGFISLGCPKNLVDSEVMMGLLDRAGARLTAHPEEAEILVVNTCSFIDTAKQESVDTILEMARHKTPERAKKLIVAGCLVERYRDEIRKSIPEVDAVVGTGELESILRQRGCAPAGRCAPLAVQHSLQRRAQRLAQARNRRPARTRPHRRAFRPEGDCANTKAASAAMIGMARRICCPPISTTKPRPAPDHSANPPPT